MEFREKAATEAAALCARLAPATADSARQRLRAFRSAIEGATKALESALTTPPDFEREVQQLVDGLSRVALLDTEAAVHRVSVQLGTNIEDLRAQLESAQEEIAALTAAVRDARERTAGFERQAAQSDQQVQALRENLAQLQNELAQSEEARGRSIAVCETESASRAQAERELQSVRSSLDASQAELSSTRAELETAAASIAALQEALAAGGRRGESLETDVADLTGRVRSLDAAVSERGARISALEAALADSTARAESLEKLLAERQDAISALTASGTDAADRADTAERALGEMGTAVATLEGALQEARDRVAALEANEAAMTSRAQESEAALLDSRTRAAYLETALHDAEGAIRDLEAGLESTAADAAARDRRAAELLDRLIDSFRSLGTATTIADVLDAIVMRLHQVFSRVALFRLKSNRLEGEHQLGFDQKSDIGKVIVPLGMDSLLTRAALSGTVTSLAGSQLAEGSGLPFAAGATWAVALPLVVHGETLAIVYADDGGEGAGAEAQRFGDRFAHALLQHAGSVLMRLTAELKALAELRDYARSLFNEIEEMFVADAIAGKAEEELRRRLVANLEYARSIYANRVALDGPGAASLLEDELKGIVETKGTTPFGRALAEVVGASGREAAAS
jgi:chromosome segregation ATPase